MLMIATNQAAALPDPAGTGLEPAGDGKMWLDGRYRHHLVSAGLTGFEAVMDVSKGRCIRALKDRENWRLVLHGPHTDGQGVYLKKHHVRTWRSLLGACLGIGPGETAGRVEARNVRRLNADGIAVMDLIAYGEKLYATGRIESFVLTEELTGYTELDHFLNKRFLRRRKHTTPRDHDLLNLIRNVATVARRFHQAGYNHRDLYCGHFFIKEAPRGQFDIKLIDLQRVQRRRWFRRRWIVKDLAQLAWSAERQHISCTHRMAFIHHYLNVEKLRPCDKRLIRSVLAKQARMERKLGLGP
jgi:hypothetical protein